MTCGALLKEYPRFEGHTAWRNECIHLEQMALLHALVGKLDDVGARLTAIEGRK
jgi:hypothetical protein